MADIKNREDVVALLRGHGVNPTNQRVLITLVLFTQKRHLSADEVFHQVNIDGSHVSKATVYNTLGLLAKKNVIREVIANPTCIFYDPNTDPHHHFYNEETGELVDIDAQEVKVTGLPPAPAGTSLQGIDVIVRLRRTI